MVESIEVDASGRARVDVLLTVSGCPMRDTLTRDVTAAVGAVPGVRGVEVTLGVMNDEQRVALRTMLKGGQAEREIPFARPDSLTSVIAWPQARAGWASHR
jgi:ATP-binding protein involved in chromosome partitioning